MFNIKYGVNTCDHIYDELMIHLTYRCPNNCPFCIDKKNKIPSIEDMWCDAKKISDTVYRMKDKINSITISGGEPLETSQCEKLIYQVKDRCPNVKINLITSLPNNIPAFTRFTNIIDKCDSISISVMSYDKRVRAKIFGIPEIEEDRADILGELKCFVPWQNKITLNFNLVKGLFDSKADIYYNLTYFNKIGYTKFRLQELTNHEALYVSIEDILEEKLKGSPFSDGCLREVDQIYKLLGPEFNGKVLVKRACFLVCEKNKATFRDLIKAATRKMRNNTFGVVYGKGELKPYWE